MNGDQPIDDAGALADPPFQFPASGTARGGDLLEADSAGREVRADRPDQEPVRWKTRISARSRGS
jgi:hypothetical protein